MAAHPLIATGTGTVPVNAVLAASAGTSARDLELACGGPVPSLQAPSLRVPAGLPDAGLWHALLGGAPLDAGELAELGQCACALRVAAGLRVFGREDGQAHVATWVASGDVALGLGMPDGSFKVERIVRGPAWLDLASIWLGAAHAFDAQAMNTVVVIELGRDALRAAIARRPSLAERFLTGLAGEVRALAVNTQELMHKDAQARLAAWLHQRCNVGEVPGQGVVALRERKRDIAAQLAITPETLSRLMRSFTQQGVLSVQGYTVRVHDTVALARLAEIH